jgi:hypothetical protein
MTSLGASVYGQCRQPLADALKKLRIAYSPVAEMQPGQTVQFELGYEPRSYTKWHETNANLLPLCLLSQSHSQWTVDTSRDY